MSRAVEEFYNRCHSHSTGRFCGGVGGSSGGGVRGDTGGNPNKRDAVVKGIVKQQKEYKRSAPNAQPARKAAAKAAAKKYGFLKTGETKAGQSGGIGGGSAGKRSTTATPAKAPRVRHNTGPTKDGSQPLGRKFKITGNKTKDHLDLLQLDRGSPERKEAQRLWNKKYGGGR